eukprot:TRINITY_DN18599_c0_g1_i1.p1 TRINITY_DN18599_c0_g1~~TRINITY_DN18599_c0_g1_i1.p1  ORF type:complete len:457 (-),score=53.00 TRINITY_DN18599_c0_g1_i1:42-1412(-)
MMNFLAILLFLAVLSVSTKNTELTIDKLLRSLPPGVPVVDEPLERCMQSRFEQLIARRRASEKDTSLQEMRDAVRNSPLEVEALLWYGRPVYVKILWPYLIRNLRRNGGVLHRIRIYAFVSAAVKSATLFAKGLSSNTNDVVYRPFVAPSSEARVGLWRKAWAELAAFPRRIFIRVDDDIVFVADGTFETIAHAALRGAKLNLTHSDNLRPDDPTAAVGIGEGLHTANIINTRHTYKLHQMLGAYPPDFPQFLYVDSRFFSNCSYSSQLHLAFASELLRAGSATTLRAVPHALQDVPYRRPGPLLETGTALTANDVFGSALSPFVHPDFGPNSCKCSFDTPRKQDQAFLSCRKGMHRWNIQLFGFDSQWLRYLRHVKMDYEEEVYFSIQLPAAVPQARAVSHGRAIAVHFRSNPQRQCARSRPPCGPGCAEQPLVTLYANLSSLYTALPLSNHFVV